MSSATATPPVATAKPSPAAGKCRPANWRLPVDLTALRAGERVLISGIDWTTYAAICAAADGYHLRMAYESGVLEAMPISTPHARYGLLFSRLATTLTEELELPFAGYDSFTLNREDLDRGIEPDKCFYLANEPRVRTVAQIDLANDPPPDLAVEVDITSSSLDRLGIYSAIGVPEIWRYDGQRIEAHRRGADGQYFVSGESGCFPGLQLSDLLPYLALRADVDQNGVIREFRAWVRDQIARGWARP